MFYVRCVMYICNERPMYVSHIHIYGHGTYSGLLFIDFNIPFHNCINLVTNCYIV